MKEKYIESPKVHYWTNGIKDKQTVVFLHPAFADHTCFEQQESYFKEKINIINVDLVGHGKSLCKATMENMSDYINQILEQEGIDQVILVGISIGAIIAQNFGQKHPKKTCGLCCVGGYDIAHFDESLQKGNSKEQLKMILKGLISIKWFAEANKKISAKTLEGQKRFYEMNLGFKKRSFMHLAGLGSLVNKGDSVDESIPLLIIVGEYDNDMALIASQTWFASKAESEFLIIKDAGHVVNLDAPDLFNEVLESFIQRIS